TSESPASGRVVAELKISTTRSLLSMRPEMQAGGRSLEVKLLRPDGSRDVLLWVKDFRQDWQTPYVFSKPVTLPAGSILQAVAYFQPASGAHLPASGADLPASGADLSGPRSVPPFTIALIIYAEKYHCC